MSYLIKDTTREKRQMNVDDALAITLLDAEYPTSKTLELASKYVEGIIEIDEIRKIILQNTSMM
jgi:hypothetical protein